MLPQLQDDPSLALNLLVAQDGNNSLKRVASVANADNRQFHSSYFLSRHDVDVFKNEVKHRQHAPADDSGDSTTQVTFECIGVYCCTD